MLKPVGKLHTKWFWLTALIVVYLALFIGLCQTPLYDISGAHNDRFFSADDIYYVEYFYSTGMDLSPRVIKHPLLIAAACAFTEVENFLFGSISLPRHYIVIVGLQLVCSLLSVVYLYKILDELYRLPQHRTLLFCGIYAAAFSTLFYTFIAESYIFSSLILIMSYYYAARKKSVMTILLGVAAAGITTINAFLWAAIVLCSGGRLRDRIKILFAGGLLFCLAVAILPIREVFYSYVIEGSLNSARNYSDNFPFFELLKRLFFAFFGSTAFYLDTMNQSPFGEFVGDALSFVPSASFPVIVMGLLWLALLVCAVIFCRKDRRLLPPLAVLLLNFLLHGVIQYGLKEAFLYSLHHLSAQILICALLLAPKEKSELPPAAARGVTIFAGIYLLAEIAFNIPGYLSILEYIAG